MTLDQFGWNEFFAQQINDADGESYAARVWRQDINQYHLMSEQGNLIGTLPGKFRNQAYSKSDMPVVGDWVLVNPVIGGERGTVQIDRLLNRKTKFSRKEAGDVVDEQIVASNIDYVFIVSGLDADFNAFRIERYLLLSWESGATPIIVLNKADVCSDIDEKLRVLEPIAQGTPILVISAQDNIGFAPLNEYIQPGKTCALLGSSGVGKSTIVNVLLGFDKFETGVVRASDSKGRHTTTFRELVVLPSGGLVVDTPGMREIQVWADQASLHLSFADIQELITQCRFSDCKHDTEPNCAVNAAVISGTLDGARLERYYKLKREVLHLGAQQDKAAKSEKKQTHKRFARLIRNRPKKR